MPKGRTLHRLNVCSCGAAKDRMSRLCRACYEEARQDQTARFWPRVDRTGECWLWMGTRDKHGYGRLIVRGRSIGAHRIAWGLARGPVPAGLYVLHRCDNPPCVRPEHLFLGTQTDNMRDASGKARLARGEARSKRLTNEDVRAIRAAVGSGVTQKELCSAYGLKSGHMSMIVNRKKWAWLP